MRSPAYGAKAALGVRKLRLSTDKTDAFRSFTSRTGLTVLILLALMSSVVAMPNAAVATGDPVDKPEGLRLLESDAAGVILELVTPVPDVRPTEIEGRLYHQVTVPGYATTGEAAKPQLPARYVLLGVPPQARLSLEVHVLEEAPPMRGLHVQPVPRPMPSPAASGSAPPSLLTRAITYRFIEDGATYASDALYPPQIASITHDGYMRDQRIVRLALHPFQVNPRLGELYHHRRLWVRLRFDYEGEVPPSVTGVTHDDAFESVYRGVLLNYESARSWRRPPKPPATATQRSALPADQPRYKITVKRDGIYRLSYADLQAAGIPVQELDPRTFRIHHLGHEVAIYVSGEEDGRFDSDDAIYFYGQGLDGKYTDVNIYWLSHEAGEGLRMAQRDVPPTVGTTPASFETTVHIEENLNYLSNLPKGEGDHWYGQYYRITPRSSVPTRTFTITLESVATGVYTATLRPLIWGQTSYIVNPDHHLKFYINDTLIGEGYWDGATAFDQELSFDQRLLTSGQNTITIEAPGDTGAEREIGYVNWLEVDYWRTYEAAGESLSFDGEGSGQQLFQVTGWASEPVLLLDVTDPLLPVRLVNAEVVSEGASKTLRFSDEVSGETHYRAATEAGLQNPEEILLDTPSTLRSPTNSADYIIISHPLFLSSVEPLAELRRSQGLQVKVVDVTDVYDEFNYGIVHPEAIHDFLDYAFHNWNPRPAYVLLVGDGTFDPRDFLGTGTPTFIPPYLLCVDPIACETAADNRYVTVEGEDIFPDLHLGRLPVNSVAEAQAVVQKLLTYDQSLPPGDWLYRILFVADNADQAGDFPALSNAVADHLLSPFYQAQKIYYMQTHFGIPETRQAILDAINEGALLVNYVGHAGITFWAAEMLFSVYSLDHLTNGDKLPVMMPMTCTEGYFHDPRFSSLAESLLRLPGHGAVASWSPTGWGVAHGHDYLYTGFYSALFEDGEARLGPATAQGKLNLLNGSDLFQDLIDTYILLGDPAMSIKLERRLHLPLLLRSANQ